MKNKLLYFIKEFWGYILWELEQYEKDSLKNMYEKENKYF